MVTNNNRYGLLISISVHLLIIALPFSVMVKNHYSEIELFVIDERPVPHRYEKRPIPNQKEVIKDIKPEITEPTAPAVIEPVVITKSVEALPKQPQPPSQPMQPEAAATPQPMSKPLLPLVDVEFGSDNAPKFLYREMPVYPILARRLGKEGKVLLRLVIDEKGALLNVDVVEGAGYGFTEAAVEAVKRSTFKPAMQDGRAVMSKAILPIRFSLRRD